MKKSIKKHKYSERYCDCGCTRFKTVVTDLIIQCRGCGKIGEIEEFKSAPATGLRLLQVQPKTRVSKFHANVIRKTWLDKFVDWLYKTFSFKRA